MNTTSRADWKLDIRLERALLFDPNRALPSCIGGSRAAPPEDCAGALDYLKRLDWHGSRPPIDELNIMAEAMRRFLDSDGNRHAIGDLVTSPAVQATQMCPRDWTPMTEARPEPDT